MFLTKSCGLLWSGLLHDGLVGYSATLTVSPASSLETTCFVLPTPHSSKNACNSLTPSFLPILSLCFFFKLQYPPLFPPQPTGRLGGLAGEWTVKRKASYALTDSLMSRGGTRSSGGRTLPGFGSDHKLMLCEYPILYRRTE